MTNQTTKFSKRVMKILRKRRGIPDDDTFKDHEIEKYTKEEALRECAVWELGDPYWATEFLQLAKGCGYKIE